VITEKIFSNHRGASGVSESGEPKTPRKRRKGTL